MSIRPGRLIIFPTGDGWGIRLSVLVGCTVSTLVNFEGWSNEFKVLYHSGARNPAQST